MIDGKQAWLTRCDVKGNLVAVHREILTAPPVVPVRLHLRSELINKER